MRKTPRRALRLFLVGALLSGPAGANAADLGSIPVPPASLKSSSKPYDHPPGSYCSLGQTNETSGFFTLLAQLLGLGHASPALFAAPVFHSGNKVQTFWGRGWSSDLDHFLSVGTGSSLTLQDGLGNRLTFRRLSASNSVPITLSSPLNEFGLAQIVSLSPAGNPTTVAIRDPEGATRIFSVAESSSVLRLTRVVDRNGAFVSYTRGYGGRLMRAEDIHGRHVELTYTAAGLVKSVADSGGRTSTFTYDSKGRKTSETGPEGTMAFQYDASDRLIRVIYPNGSMRNYAYDSVGRVVSEDDGNGSNRLTYVYESSRTIVTDSLSRETIYEYVERGGLRKISAIIDSSGNSSRFTYDNAFNLSSETDARGHTTRYGYDLHGSITRIENAAGHISRASYEPSFHQLASAIDPLGHEVRFEHDSSGNVILIRDPGNNITRFRLDAFGRPIEVRDPEDGLAQITYNPSNGAVASLTDPLGRTTSFQTDALSRVTRKTDAAGKHTDVTYDSVGNVTSVTDALGKTTTFSYVPGRRGKLLSSVKDANAHTTTFAYDQLGRVTRVTNPRNQQTRINYDSIGRPSLITTRNGKSIGFAYDQNDRLAVLSTVEGDSNFSYDANGNATSLVGYNGSAFTATYDSLDRITQTNQTLPNGFSAAISYASDGNGNRRSMTTPWGTFTYEYDSLNRVTRIDPPNEQAITFAYDSLGRRTATTLPNGTQTIYSYDAAGQVAQVLHKRTGDQVHLASAAYTYDTRGNRATVTDEIGLHSFTYDSLNRVATAAHPPASGLPAPTESFTYDAVGNRLSDSSRSDYQYDSANRLISDSSFTYTSDANGNITSRTDRITGATTTFEFDTANRLVRTVAPSGAVTKYKYDAVGRRVEKDVAGIVSRYIYDGQNILAVLDGANNLRQLFTHGPGIDAPLKMDSAGHSYFFHPDALGSVSALSNSAGDVIERYEYAAFGSPVVKSGTGVALSSSGVSNPFTYIGREFDDDTGLFYLRGRHLDPETGRFIQEDPLANTNQYAYANNNPIVLVDRFGLQAENPIINFIGGWGAGAALQPGTNPYDYYNTGSAAYQAGSAFGLAVSGTLLVLAAAMAAGIAIPTVSLASLGGAGASAVGAAAVAGTQAGPASSSIASRYVVLGHVGEYEYVAQQLGLLYFKVSAEVWKARGLALNAEFLARIAREGRTVILAPHMAAVRAGSTLAWEINVLMTKYGYTLNQRGTMLCPPKKG